MRCPAGRAAPHPESRDLGDVRRRRWPDLAKIVISPARAAVTLPGVNRTTATTISLYVVGAFVGFLIALVTAFWVPARPVPLGVVATMLLIGPYAHLLGRALRSSLAAAVPSVMWLVTTMVLASARPEGDLIVTGTLPGVLFLLLGTVSCVVGIGTVRAGVARSDRKAAARAIRAAEAEAADAEVAPR